MKTDLKKGISPKPLNLRTDSVGPRTSLCVYFTVLENATI